MSKSSMARALSPLADELARARALINDIIIGKPEVVDLAFTALLAGGHLLLEDLPGVGKTTLAQALSLAVGGSWQRIQFTSDMLPADIVGVSVFSRADEQFEFRPGPVFANVVLADEINRATPRTQSALLEAMAERQVTVDGQTHPLPQPFYVIATQNPVDLSGTYPLPDSQLDRFLLRVKMGYPSPEQERRLLVEPNRRELLADMQSVLTPGKFVELIELARRIHVSDPVLDYIQALVAASRSDTRLKAGLSPRAALSMLQTARAHALVKQQDFCLPDNVQAVFPALAGHRLQAAGIAEVSGERIAAEILESTPVP
ncbi:MAG TPA: MoxR family ATPase [Wenzhouxiangella sp.]|nr:MoxR family ATPase [Wenzhouxiangella sp.]